MPQAHRLKNFSVTGGFLDGLTLEFSAGLNCLIGARGSGKSSVLEFIRYALQLLPADPALRKRVEALVEANLGAGCIRLTLETPDGLTYIVSRTFGDEPLVMDSKGNPTDITLSSRNLFRAHVFSQNDVESIAADPVAQLALIDSFNPDGLRALDTDCELALGKLATNARECADLHKKMAGLSDELSTLPGIEARLAEHAQHGQGDTATLNDAHAQKALRAREQHALTQLRHHFDTLTDALTGLTAQVVRGPVPLTDAILDGPNGALLKQLRAQLLERQNALTTALERIQKEVAGSAKLTLECERQLVAHHRKQELDFQNVLIRFKAVDTLSGQRASLEKSRNELLGKSELFKDCEEKLRRLTHQRQKLLAELTALQASRFAKRKTITDAISAAVAPHVRISVEQFATVTAYQALLERCLKGAGIQHGKVAQKIAQRIPPADFVALVREEKTNLLASRGELNAEQARKVLAAVHESGLIYSIEIVDLPDAPTIELRDGLDYKNSLALSTGQKCTSILPILLMDNVCPLLIDQPEDNLDNRFIYTTVVQRLREVKRNRQLIFITHNPNVPVLGDADRVIVLNSSGQQAELLKSGTVDECRDPIITILEGGAEAFKERRKRYSLP